MLVELTGDEPFDEGRRHRPTPAWTDHPWNAPAVITSLAPREERALALLLWLDHLEATPVAERTRQLAVTTSRSPVDDELVRETSGLELFSNWIATRRTRHRER